MPPRTQVWKKPRAAKKRVPRARKPLMKLMKQVATKVFNAGLETKYVTESINNILFNSAISSGSEQYSLYPQLGQGTGTYQRVGIDVTPMRVKNTWVISLAPLARTSNLIVDLWLMIDKNNRYYPQIVASGSPQFLRTGNGSSVGNVQGFNGFNTDAFRMINKERYTLLKHFRFQLASNVGNANGDITAGNAPNVAGQSMKTIEYIVDTPKQLRYNPALSSPDYPNGHAPFWCLGYSKVDGSPPDVLNQSVTVSHISEMIYKDA